MKDIILKGLKIFGSLLIVSIISFFLVVSFSALEVGLFSSNIGYDVYGRMSEEAEPEYLYTYYTADGEDTKAKEYEENGYVLSKFSIRSEVDKGADIGMSVLSQLFCLLILISFIYNDLWRAGNKDFEATRIHGAKFGKLKGGYIGLVGIAPMFIMLTVFLIGSGTFTAKLPIAIFTFSNCYAYEIIYAVTDGMVHWADVGIWQIVAYYAVLLIVPIISMVSYIIGYKDISIAEKLIYKNSSKRRRV